MDSVCFIDSIAQIIIPLGVCVVLPVLVVWLVSRLRKNDIDRKTEVMLKAIEHGQEIDPEAFSSRGKGHKTIKMALLGKLQYGLVLLLIGAGLLTAAPFVEENTALYILGGILVALGAGFLVSFFVGRKWLAPEIEAEQKQILEQSKVESADGSRVQSKEQKNPSEE